MPNTRKKKNLVDILDEEENDDLASQIKELKNTIDFMSEKLVESNDRNSKILKLMKEQHKENKYLKEKVQKLEINLLEQESIKNNVTIHGVDIQEKEEVVDVVLKIAQGMNSSLKKEEILDCFRKGKNMHSSSTLPPQIFVKFINSRAKIELLAKRKDVRSIRSQECNLKGNRDIYINEHLTEFNNQLYFEARKLKKNNKLKWLWIMVRYGKIFVRRDDMITQR